MLDTIRWRILLVALAGWVNRWQLEVIAYLREENRVLKEHLGGQRLHLTDPERRRLGATGMAWDAEREPRLRRSSRRIPSYAGTGS
jgi:hypothetical protein